MIDRSITLIHNHTILSIEFHNSLSHLSFYGSKTLCLFFKTIFDINIFLLYYFYVLFLLFIWLIHIMVYKICIPLINRRSIYSKTAQLYTLYKHVTNLSQCVSYYYISYYILKMFFNFNFTKSISQYDWGFCRVTCWHTI